MNCVLEKFKNFVGHFKTVHLLVKSVKCSYMILAQDLSISVPNFESNTLTILIAIMTNLELMAVNFFIASMQFHQSLGFNYGCH